MAKGKTAAAKTAVVAAEVTAADVAAAKVVSKVAEDEQVDKQWAEVASLYPSKQKYKQTCKNMRSLDEFKDADGKVDQAALDKEIADEHRKPQPVPPQ